jgi:hypothetical protein
MRKAIINCAFHLATSQSYLRDDTQYRHYQLLSSYRRFSCALARLPADISVFVSPAGAYTHVLVPAGAEVLRQKGIIVDSGLHSQSPLYHPDIALNLYAIDL